MKRLPPALLMLLALASGTVTAAPAWQDDQHAGAGYSSGISLDQAVEQVRRETGGRILSAETLDKNGQQVYRIKVLTPDHKVVIREINASGR